MPQSNSHVFNAGGPVWGFDWCPIHPDDRERRYDRLYLFFSLLSIVHRRFVPPVYVAVGAHPSAYTPKIGTKVSRPSLSNIQIWSFGLEEGKPTTRCEALLCIESGHTNELKWCPLPSHDPVSWVFPRNTSFSLRIISSERRAARVNLVNWVYLLEPSRMGRSPCLLFRIQETSSRQTPQVQFMVRSGIPSSLSSSRTKPQV
jgi:hypothetical protein